MNYIKNIVVFAGVFFMQFASATSTTSGWNVGSAVAQGATTVYTATKDIGGKVVTSVAKITPTSAQVAKGLSKGLFAGLALSVAQKLIEDGVDFVLDPANNELRYTPKADKNKIYQYKFVSPYGTAYTISQAQSISDQYLEKTYSSSIVKYSCYIESSGGFFCPYRYTYDSESMRRVVYFVKDVNEDYDPKATQKSIPFTQLASQIIGEANNNNEDAKAITSVVAQSATASNTDDQLVPYTQLTQALDASVPTSQDDTKSPPATNTNTGSQSQTQDQSKPDESASNPTATPTPSNPSVPTDCGFFQTACTWFDWTKTQYNDSVKAVKDYFKDPEEQTDKDNTIDEEPTPTIKNDYIKFSESCPFVPETHSITIGDQTVEIASDMTQACKTASDMRPLVLLLGALISFGICCGFNFSGSTGED